MAGKYGEHDRIYTDGSLMDDKVGFAVVTNNVVSSIRKQMDQEPENKDHQDHQPRGN
jgi:hypothetical protein